MSYSQGIQSFKVLKPKNVISVLLDYIENKLPEFVGSHTFENVLVTRKNETRHTTAFSLFMMKSQDRFSFINEVQQKGSFTVDIGVFDRATDGLIFTIEAKVLPTPPGTKKKPRSFTEYVYAQEGHSGAGIERFKNGYHGLDNRLQPLSESGMLAYINKEDFRHWHSTVNEWISQTSWDVSETLTESYITTVGKFISKHLRADNSVLTLHHFWVKLPGEHKS